MSNNIENILNIGSVIKIKRSNYYIMVLGWPEIGRGQVFMHMKYLSESENILFVGISDSIKYSEVEEIYEIRDTNNEIPLNKLKDLMNINDKYAKSNDYRERSISSLGINIVYQNIQINNAREQFKDKIQYHLDEIKKLLESKE